MLSREQNELICKTGLGTPAGDLFRRYWLPVGLSKEVVPDGKPRQVKIMGEELVLFRDDKGRAGLLGLHCSHRLTSLAYGRVEDGGIRCPFHGWLYDIEGRCLEQPAEPEPFRERICHLAYPCQELAGLIFAYMGPRDKMPLLPRYEVMVREDGTRKVDSYTINSNYLQGIEGAIDMVHAAYLHMENWSKAKRPLAALPKTRIELAEADFGIWLKTRSPLVGVDGPVVGELCAHFFMPVGYIRTQDSIRGSGDIKKFQSWFVPVDDTHTIRFQVSFAPFGTHGGSPYRWPVEKEPFTPPGPAKDYYRDYENVDTISAIPSNAPGSTIKGFLVQDSMVNETQGPLMDRSKEHLGALDKIFMAIRATYLVAIQEVKSGRDPKHIIREPRENEIVYLRGNDPLELV